MSDKLFVSQLGYEEILRPMPKSVFLPKEKQKESNKTSSKIN